MTKRLYRGKNDLYMLQEFNAKAAAETDCCGYLHPGDIPHCSNSAAFKLYKNCGFEIWHEQNSYSKKIK